MNGSIYHRVVLLLGSYTHVPSQQIKPETTLRELGIDSLSALSLLHDIETEFRINVDALEAPDLVGMQITIEHIADRVESALQKFTERMNESV